MGKIELIILRIWLVVSFVTLTWLLSEKLFNEESISSFKVIEAERINIRESDGTLRIAISNKEKQDNGNIDGLEIHEPGTRHAGMIFFNDQGTEAGGLIFGGKSKGSTGASLTFDRWRNDQTIQLLYSDSKSRYTSGLIVSDRPNDDTLLNLVKRQKSIKKLQGQELKQANTKLSEDIKSKKINLGTTRVFSGIKNKVAQYVLYDSDGKVKVKISAEPNKPGKIELFDNDGNLISR
ncbi:MAG: hypothetical protein HOO06_04055 [Bdellovibrionaceae bacterium]|jgi:hypothetical protein|nr:hypothetical protein [Pseudobdellovibrionaceae bacterium]